MAAITDKLNTTSSFDEFYSVNKDALAPLIAEFGQQIFRATWDAVSPEAQTDFLTGKKALADHIHQLRKGCVQQLIDKVKRANKEALSSLYATSEIVVDRILSEYTVSELHAFAQESESLAPQLTALRKRAHYLRKVARENRILLDHFVAVYSYDVVKGALLTMPAQKRALLKNGCIPLAEFKEEFRARCEGPPKPPFLTEEELLAYLKTARPVRFIEAAHGVYVLEGMHGAAPLSVVVKIPSKPNQETFATQLLSSMQIKTPSLLTIDRSNPALFSAALDVLRQDKTFQQREYLPKRICAMDFIKGVPLEDATAEQLLATEEETLYHRVLFEIGELAAADLLLYFQDRFPTIGIGNTANAMLEQDESDRFKGVFAIDQLAYLTSQPSIINRMLNVNPFSRIETLVRTLDDAPEAISLLARDLFETGLSDEQQRSLDKPRALQALQKGLMSGLSKIAILSEERLIALHQALPASLHERDTVDLPAYLTMLRTIQAIVLT